MGKSFIIRRMKAEDLHRVWEIDVQSFSLPWTESSFRYDYFVNKNSRMWVVETIDDSGSPQVIGSMVAWLILDEVHLGTIAVDSKFRKQGIGETLIRTLLQEMASEGAVRVELEVRRSNIAALSLYQKFGFIVDGERKNYYSDNHEDAILMGLTIGKPSTILPNQ
ncbi:MAG: ribosomal protein S18-alanine N-acetyltransferase [Anaerolineaceae bacterium]|nr:ribosomal protein S18-alanine N-acetyltransferase [Anaerolineaceae bacterium]